MTNPRTQPGSHVRRSALWAAYGDALGFISELVDAKGLKRRIGADRIVETVPWSRQIGGRFGPRVELPAGCYSDDTQLRLATSRSIRSDGTFDAEVFAKIELPVWRCYALGAGRGTKAAASNLSKRDFNWFSNFFRERSSRYVDGGGNGAAMRIQPHVWAATDRARLDAYLPDVIRNSVCTHGHMRGIVGACFHASLLASSLDTDEVPSPAIWLEIAASLKQVERLVREDPDLSQFWLPSWEEQAGLRIGEALSLAIDELANDIKLIGNRSGIGPSYRSIVESIGGLDPAQRGSGTKTALLAAAVSWAFREQGPEPALLEVVNLCGSDTDTIATMVGAMLGSVAREEPRKSISDRGYISSEADRLDAIASGHPGKSFDYPDPMSWDPPRTQTEAVGRVRDRIALAGLGYGEFVGNPSSGSGRDDSMWQWVRLDFGQSVLAKRKSVLKEQSSQNINSAALVSKGLGMQRSQTSLFPDRDKGHRPPIGQNGQQSINELSRLAISSEFDPMLIGSHILLLSEAKDGIERAIAYASIVAKARIARRDRDSR